MPERFQTRLIPVKPSEEGELEEEAEWVFEHAFVTSPISKQVVCGKGSPDLHTYTCMCVFLCVPMDSLHWDV